ncbi:MAG: phosphatidylserine decarboxylase [Gammaproteobacteria bacterium]|nr:phosphatidylserine decarboxylase [Gammaproteobacteria bacterium]
MLKALNTYILYILPHHLLTRAMRALTRLRIPFLVPIFIRIFVRLFHVDLNEAENPDVRAYRHFDDFFTRALRPNARPLAKGASEAVCPVDGTVSQLGSIREGRLYQAKGIDYSLETLLGGHEALAREFRDGDFITLYLSPRDYHRIHMPLDGTLREMHYVPGRLFSVSPHSTSTVNGLFARNERLVTIFDSECGPMAVILVGAMFVSGIETVWSGMVTQGRSGDTATSWDFTRMEPPVRLERGQEMGRFHMGSTVILCLPKERLRLAQDLIPGTLVRMGQSIGGLVE